MRKVAGRRAITSINRCEDANVSGNVGLLVTAINRSNRIELNDRCATTSGVWYNLLSTALYHQI